MRIPLVDLKIQYAGLENDMQAAVKQVFANGNYILGAKVTEFEKRFGELSGVKHMMGCSCGTSAIFLALQACGIKPGDEVIVPANTFIATAEAVSLIGAKPVFVDCEEETGLMDATKLSALINAKTKAIIPVHLYGQICDMDAIIAIARPKGIKVIEDSAQAHLATYKGRKAGSIGDMATFSFFPGKNLGAYGDAGAVSTQDDALAKQVKTYRNHGRESKYAHDQVGFNFRMDELQAAFLGVKLNHIEKWTASRRRIAARYREKLQGTGDIRFFRENSGNEAVYHLFVIRSAKREAIGAHLKEMGVDTGVHYPLPLHLQPAYQFLGYSKGAFPVSEKHASEMLSLPVYPEMTDEQVDYVCGQIQAFFKAAK